jgi:hypothetical protein
MSRSPIEWRDNVVEHYGSIAAFHDVSTVEIVREQVAKKRADLKIIFDAEASHPGIVEAQDLAKMRAEDAELASLDEDLLRWQDKRRQAVA